MTNRKTDNKCRQVGDEPFIPGLGLRDWFAAQAIQGLVAACVEGDREMEESNFYLYAREAYALADAMLKTRLD